MSDANAAPKQPEVDKVYADGAQVATLIDDLRSKDNKVRRKAIDTLARLGPAAKPAVPALTEILKDRHSSFRLKVAISFNQILPPYVDLLKLFPDLRYVGKIQPVDQWPADRREKLAKAKKIANDEAAEAIAVALPALVDALTDENANLRQYAALSLGACGSLAGDSVPALIPCTQR
jgi:HEAT repeat protein